MINNEFEIKIINLLEEILKELKHINNNVCEEIRENAIDYSRI